MHGSGDPDAEIQALKQRVAALSAAVLRVSDSLDLATVLQEVVDSARALTGARYGVICTVDETGEVRDFVTSGFTPEEKRRFAEWPDGPRLFAHLRDQPGPLRLADLPDYVHERGFSPELMRSKTLQSMPMRHRGEAVGHFFLAEKEDAATFTAEDEETLELFAAQAAAAIANARAFRGEARARSDLEVLIETSPVGVAVLDARTGRATFNHEARRIVERLRSGDEAPEDMLDTLTCRFADGRELALAEFPIERALAGAEALRAEEIVLSVPDGRSARALFNVSPIRDDCGDVASVVVTLQDLAPLEELERLRAEFVSMVSHELRAPLAAIKGSAAAVLGSPRAVPRAEMLQFFRIVDGQADRMRGLIGDLLDAGRIEAGTLSVEPQPTEVAALADRARETFLHGGARHAVRIDLPPDLPPVMADPERVEQVLVNLLANAARHSPESAPIRVEAAREGAHVAVAVADRGRGVAPELLRGLFRKHVALAGGRGGDGDATGLGLAICKGLVEAHGGRIRAESPGPGGGARFTFTLPAAAAQTGPADGRAPLRDDLGGRPRVLVVDDDPDTLRFARGALAEAGYAVVTTGEPGEVGALMRRERPRLVLLDLLLPGVDGIALMQTVPELGDVPVIFISGYGRDETIERALDAGAADYIVKPFSPIELRARVAAALRAQPEAFAVGDLAIDYARRRATVAGRELELTATEYELLRVLSENAGRVVTFEALLRQAWGGGERDDAQPVRAFVRKLRVKLGDDAAQPRYLFNARGVGYRLAGPEGD